MFDILFRKGALPLLEKGIYFSDARHRVLVNNIANIDTPFYKDQDLPEGEFKDVLAKSIEARDRRTVRVFDFQGSSSVREKPNGDLDVAVGDSDLPGVLRHSENNVNPDREAAKLVQNAGLHDFLTRLYAQEMNLLDAAVRERPSAG